MNNKQQEYRLTYTVPEVAKLIGLSRASTYEAVHTCQILNIRIGRSIIIPKIALERMLDEASSGRANSKIRLHSEKTGKTEL